MSITIAPLREVVLTVPAATTAPRPTHHDDLEPRGGRSARTAG